MKAVDGGSDRSDGVLICLLAPFRSSWSSWLT